MSSLAASRRATLIGSEAAQNGPAAHGGRISLDPAQLGGTDSGRSGTSRLGGTDGLRARSRLSRLAGGESGPLPDWLAELRQTVSPDAPSAPDSAETGKPVTDAAISPDTTSSRASGGDRPDTTPALSTTPSSANFLDDLLNSDDAGTDAALPPYLANAAPPVSDDTPIPDWLANLAPTRPDTPASATPADVTAADTDASTDGLRDAGPQPNGLHPFAAFDAPDLQPFSLDGLDMPDWLQPPETDQTPARLRGQSNILFAPTSDLPQIVAGAEIAPLPAEDAPLLTDISATPVLLPNDLPPVAGAPEAESATPPVADTTAALPPWGAGVAPWLRGMYPPSEDAAQQSFDDTFGGMTPFDLSALTLPDDDPPLDMDAEATALPAFAPDLAEVAPFAATPQWATAAPDEPVNTHTEHTTSPFSLTDVIAAFDDIEPTPPPAAPMPDVADVIPMADMPQVAETAPPDADVPEWLRAMHPGATPAAPAPETTKAGGYSSMASDGDASFAEDALPAWLRDAAPAQPAPAAIPDAPAPDWLQSLAPGHTPPPPTDPHLMELPDWLDEITAEDEPAQAAPLLAAQPADDTFNSLFRRLSADVAAQPAPSDANTSVPNWMKGDASGLDDKEITLPPLMSPQDLPAWLRAGTGMLNEREFAAHVAEEVPQPQQAAPLPPPLPVDVHAIAADLADTRPTWVNRLGEQPTARIAAPVAPPDWLQQVPAQTVPSDVAPNAFPLPDEFTPVVSLPPRIADAAVMQSLAAPSDADLRAASEARVIAPARKGRDRLRLVGWVVVALLALVIVLAVVFKPFGTPAPKPAAQTQRFYDAINALPKGQAHVLMVYDWDADKTGELGPAARAITQHLIYRAARIATVSTLPQGAALAASITDPIAASTDPAYKSNYVYGDQYVHLGYRPGTEIALRGLNGPNGLYDYFGNDTDYTGTIPLTQAGALKGVNSLADFDMVILLAGDDTALRAWVTQYGTTPGAKLAVVLPAASIPTALPILSATTAQPRGALLGLQGVAEYNTLLNADNVPHVAALDGRLNAQVMASASFIALLVGANVLYFVRRRP